MVDSMKKNLIAAFLLLVCCAEFLRDFTSCRITKYLYIVNLTSDTVYVEFTDSTAFDTTSHWGVSDEYEYPQEIPDGRKLAPSAAYIDSIRYYWEVEHGSKNDDVVCRDSLFRIDITLLVRSGDSLIGEYPVDMECAGFEFIREECGECLRSVMYYADGDTIGIE
jgi:hypothetical protein